MRRLLMLRHAKAEKSAPGGGDFDRALASRGREQAPKIGV
jgi:phosphohistidine phosphatase SixA